VFSRKQPQIGWKRRLFEINIHFAALTCYPLFAPKQTFARIEFLRQCGLLVSRKGSNNVKILAENKTKKQLCRMHARIGNETENTCAYHYQCVRLQGLPPKANGESIMETHK